MAETSYSRYDPEENVIFTDVSGVKLDRQTLETVLDEIDRLAAGAGQRPYVVACWKDATIDSEVLPYWGERIGRLLKENLAGLTRYGATDPATRSFLRSAAIQHGLRGTTMAIYETKEEALEAIRKMRRAE